MRRGKRTQTFSRNSWAFLKRMKKEKKKKVETWIPMTRRWKFICNARSRTYNFYIYTVVIRKKMIFIDCIKRRDVSRLKRYIYIYISPNLKISTLFRQTSRRLSRLHRTSIAPAVFSHFFPHFATQANKLSSSLPSPGRWRLDASNRK